MVGNCPRQRRIVRTELGEQTGEEFWQTEDGQWWEEWDGYDRTGQELRTKRGYIVE
jgi:hypothetical protein